MLCTAIKRENRARLLMFCGDARGANYEQEYFDITS